ncbi:MAG: D-alanyl-D-alanine carboxypeptidase [Clostridia bacterium]|nr:D-alanyl-D-alanine carboxypeptidase [Clostridia bacterium]NCC42727.1 D-alanyl-D-alanine carboxypeptidase [Clostridia bacterium]
MRKRGISLLLVFMMVLRPFTVYAEVEKDALEDQQAVVTEAPSVMLMEVSTGTVLYEKNAKEERSPASITKIMTLLLIFEALERSQIKMDDEVITSVHAKSMGGSQVFLEEGEKQTVETMIKCIVIASGNDASVAMAEHIAGSEADFVKRMNQRAGELGMVHTKFEDCCGLTDSAGHYTTAEDVAVVSRELLGRYPKILEYSSIWMENITHITNKGESEFGLTNTNKLIRSYEGCVGLKTGSTSTAKFCVSAAAQRGDIMLLAVVMGAQDPKTRFKDAASLLNYGFGICTLFKDENTDTPKKVKLSGGVVQSTKCAYKEPFYYLDTKGQGVEGIEKKLIYDEKLKAPVKEGDTVGKAIYTREGKEIGSVELVSTQNIRKANYMDYLKKTCMRLIHMREKEQKKG